MSLSLIIDMNLSPEWADALRSRGHDALHWMDVGEVVAAALAQYEGELRARALVVVEAQKSRVRVLPL